MVAKRKNNMDFHTNKARGVFCYKIIGKIFGTALGMAILFILLYRVDISRTYQALLSYKIPFVFVGFFAVLCTIVLDGACQYILLDSKRIPVVTFVIRICQAQLFSIFLPGRLGDISILFLLKEESKAKLAKAYLFSKLITISMILLFGFPLISRLTHISLIIVLLISVSIFLFITVTYYNLQAVWNILLKFPFDLKFIQMQVIPSSSRAYLSTVLLTIIRFILSALGNYTLLYAGGIPLPFLTVLQIICLVQLTSLIPIAPLGLGVVEFTIVYLYSLYGIEQSVGIIVPLIGRFLQAICFMLFALTQFWFPLHEVKNAKNEDKTV